MCVKQVRRSVKRHRSWCIRRDRKCGLWVQHSRRKIAEFIGSPCNSGTRFVGGCRWSVHVRIEQEPWLCGWKIPKRRRV